MNLIPAFHIRMLIRASMRAFFSARVASPDPSRVPSYPENIVRAGAFACTASQRALSANTIGAS